MSSVATAMTGFPWELGAIALGVAGVLAAMAAAIQSWVSPPRDVVVARIEDVASRPDSAAIRLGGPAGAKVSDWLSRLAGPVVALLRPTRSEELSQLRSHLMQAGLRSKHAMEAFLASKLILAAAATLSFLNINGRLPGGLRFPVVGGAALVVCAAAFFLPNLWLASLSKRRKSRVGRGLPDAMDLLVTCVEAGLGLDAALARVATELKLVAPLLAAELNMTFLETKAGISRREAFKRLSERTGVDDLRQLAAVLAQTEIFGTSIARALRVHADGMRIMRMQHAERKAAMVGVKMTFPLVLCVLPVLIAVVLGPAIVSIAEHLMEKGL
jgi:tight adherence protein C